LSIEEESPIQEVIDANLVPRLIQLLEFKDMPQIQYEAAWCLTNIATGTTEQTQCLTEKGAIARFIMLINSEHDNLKEQVLIRTHNFHRQSGHSETLPEKTTTSEISFLITA